MPKIYLCFVWHMHQPLYKDSISGEFKLPWARLHALKDYYGMVHILQEFPPIRQTFNLVPSLVVQLEEYAAGKAVDPFLRCALKPSEDLTEEEQDFVLRNFLENQPERLIGRYPRYGELYDAWRAAGQNVARARRFLNAQAFRDLQVLSQVAWFDEEFLSGDADVRTLVGKGRDFTLEDQAAVGRKQGEILAAVLPAYQEFAAKGQIEISTSPFYHPILPLLCDSNIAAMSHPGVRLPSRFHYPQDARVQLERARQFTNERFGRSPSGLWPSEGSVSDEVLSIAAETGFEWIASDIGVLERTLSSSPSAEGAYRPYLWSQEGRQIHVVFRDRFLSDLIGFVYARLGAAEAAVEFLSRIRENCRDILKRGHDVLVSIILDGENAWEYYQENGRPFLRELYRRISQDPEIVASTVREALERLDSHPMDRIFPGSWINANFDIWIGAEEDNRAWEYLLRARETYERTASAPRKARPSDENCRLAYEELLIAEGSDWCWWYGPEHESLNRPEFDRLYREHLATIYRALGQTPPDELSRPILKVAVREFHVRPSGAVRPTIDGEVTSFFEWLGAGIYHSDPRFGAMHGRKCWIRELHYGSDGLNLYLRIDFDAEPKDLASMEARVNIQPANDASFTTTLRLRLEGGRAVVVEMPSGSDAAECAFQKVLEIRVSLAALAMGAGEPLRLQASLWHEGLPMDAVPHQGWLDCLTTQVANWPE